MSSRPHTLARHWLDTRPPTPCFECYHLHIATGPSTYSSCMRGRPPAFQSAHTRQGCGSLRRRVLSECRVLARLEASPVTGLLGMERNRQGTTVLASRPGFSPPRGCRAWGQACRRAGVPKQACQPGPGRKGAFRDLLFQDSFATTPFAALLGVPRAWHPMARYGHGVTHATVTHSELPPPADPGPFWGPASHSQSHGHHGPAADDSTPPSPRHGALAAQERRGRDPTRANKVESMGGNNLATNHVPPPPMGYSSSCQSIQTHGRLIPRASPKPRLQRQA